MDPPGPLRIGLALAAGAIASWLARRQPASVRRPFLLLGLAILPLLPILTGHGRLLLAFQDRTLVLVASSSVALALVAVLRARRTPAPAVPTWALALLAFAAYAALGTRVPGRAGPQGDEPQYLLLAQSLVQDGDLDLANQFAERQYAGFYGGELEPHASPASPPGRLYTTHAPGLGILIAPAYALGGYRFVVLFLAALAAAGTALLRAVVRDATGDEWLALAAWAIVALTPPLPVFALAVYPETAAVSALGLLLWLRLGAPGPAQALVAAAIGGGLTWLHPKMLPLGALACALVLLRVRGRATRGVALVVWALAAGSFLLYMRLTFGHATLSAGFGDPQLSLLKLPWGLLAMLFDRQSGLLTIAPVWVLAAFGLGTALRERPREVLPLLALAAIPVAIGGSYGDWAGGDCPPGRFPVPALAPACVLLATALARRPRLGAALAGAGIGVLLVAAAVPAVLRTGTPGEGHLLRELSPVDLNAVFPSFVEGRPASAMILALTLAAAAALAWQFRARGLLLGAGAYLLLASTLAERELVHPAASVRRVLQAWDGRTQLSPQGMLDPARLALPLRLLDSVGAIPAGELRRTRRVLVPPGEYELHVRAASGGTPSLARVDASASNVPLAAGALRGGETLVLPLTLPCEASGFAYAVAAEQGATLVEDAWLRPLALVPRSERTELVWSGRPRTDRYRIERGALRVTLAEGFVREGEGFRLETESGRLLVDGPPRAVARLTIVRAAPRPGELVRASRVELPLDDAPASTFDVPLSQGQPLGSAAVLAVRVRARGALVSVQDAPTR